MKTWLITGCSSGLGRGIAKAALDGGDQVIVTARNADTLKRFEEIYASRACALTMDVTDKDSIRRAVEWGIRTFGKIDVLVNNAGYGYRSAIEEGDTEEVGTLFQTNLFGPIEVMKQVLPGMRERHSGLIINIASIAAEKAAPGSGYYAASKAALARVSDALRKEVKPLGIDVLLVEPGAFRTNFFTTSLRDSTNQIKDYDETAGKRRKVNQIGMPQVNGDPELAGGMIAEIAKRDDRPDYLLLGSDAVDFVTHIWEKRRREIDQWHDFSIKSDNPL